MTETAKVYGDVNFRIKVIRSKGPWYVGTALGYFNQAKLFPTLNHGSAWYVRIEHNRFDQYKGTW